MNTSAAYKWRITNAKYIYITDEGAYGPFIYNSLDDSRIYHQGESEINEVDEALIKRNVSAMDEIEYEESFNKMAGLLKTDEDGQYLQLLDYTAYLNDLKECTDDATDVTCNPMDIVFEATAKTYPSDSDAEADIYDIVDEVLPDGTKRRTFYVVFGIPSGADGKPGEDGKTPSIEIINKYWYINGKNTGIKARGDDGNGIANVILLNKSDKQDQSYYYIQLKDGKILSTSVPIPDSWTFINYSVKEKGKIILLFEDEKGDYYTITVECEGVENESKISYVTTQCYEIVYDNLARSDYFTVPFGPQGPRGPKGEPGECTCYPSITEKSEVINGIKTATTYIKPANIDSTASKSVLDIKADTIKINGYLDGTGTVNVEDGNVSLLLDNNQEISPVVIQYDGAGLSLNKNNSVNIYGNTANVNTFSTKINAQETFIGSTENSLSLTHGEIIIHSDNGIGIDTYVNASGGFYETSDIRKKSIKSNISLDKAYDLINKCSAIVYTLKDEINSKEQIGLIAQEVEVFFPEVISEDKDGFKSLDYSRITVVLLSVIKDLITRIEKLEK